MKEPRKGARGLIGRLLAARARPPARAEDKGSARWESLKAEAAGMLDPAVYRELYRLGRDAPDLDVVEIGGAAGAGTIALALGMKESGKHSGVIVAEKLEGGSRLEVGDRAANLRHIEGNFEKFGVAGQVRLFPREVTLQTGPEIAALVRTKEIAALVHDADGRIDRDFLLFWPLLREGGAIVIDDYADAPSKFRPISPRYPLGGIKPVVTFRLTNRMIDWGLLRVTQQVGHTLFGVKPPGADFTRFDRSVCDRLIEEVERERDAALHARRPE